MDKELVRARLEETKRDIRSLEKTLYKLSELESKMNNKEYRSRKIRYASAISELHKRADIYREILNQQE